MFYFNSPRKSYKKIYNLNKGIHPLLVILVFSSSYSKNRHYSEILLPIMLINIQTYTLHMVGSYGHQIFVRFTGDTLYYVYIVHRKRNYILKSEKRFEILENLNVGILSIVCLQPYSTGNISSYSNSC